jgi:hypothetical protein
MTKTPSDLDVLERRLSQSFVAAHDDPRWAGDTWLDPMGRLGRARRAHNRRIAAVSALAATGLAAGAIAGVSALSTTSDRVRVVGPAGHPDAGSGLDWLLTTAQYDDYTAAHPSPSPPVDRVPSPAPVDDQLRGLEADIAAALPADAQTVRADAADGGVNGDATVWLRLSDGTPVAVERLRLEYPRVLSTTTDSSTEELAPEHFTDPQTWDDGTAYTIVTGQAWGYGLDEQTQWDGPFVWTVTSDGWFTMWTAPVSRDRLLGWAQAADAHFTATR